VTAAAPVNVLGEEALEPELALLPEGEAEESAVGGGGTVVDVDGYGRTGSGDARRVKSAVDGGSYSSASGTNNGPQPQYRCAHGAHSLSAKSTDTAGISATSSTVSINVNNGTTAADCTLFASPSGNNANSGSSASSPKTFTGAAPSRNPVPVVCLLAGTYNLGSTFYPPTSGSPSSWIVYKSYGGRARSISSGLPCHRSAHVQVRRRLLPFRPCLPGIPWLNLDGQNNALDGFFCQGDHHLRFIGNSTTTPAAPVSAPSTAIPHQRPQPHQPQRLSLRLDQRHFLQQRSMVR